MPDFNPYAAPSAAASDEDLRSRGRFSGAFIKWVFLAVEASRLAAVLPTHVAPVEQQTASLIDGYWRLGAFVGSLVGVWWLWAACSAIPQRALDQAKLSPGRAVGLLFVPCLNLAWIFAVQLRLCEALDAAFVRCERPAPRLQPVAMLAVVTHFVAGLAAFFHDPLTNVVANSAAAAAWFAYMAKFDRALADLDVASRAAPAAVG